MPLRHNVIGFLSLIATLLGIPIIAIGAVLANQLDNSCLNILQWPLIILGALIFIAGLLGCIAGFMRIQSLLKFYFLALPLLFLLLLCLVGFVFLVTVRGSGQLQPNRAYLEYRLDDFSGWLRRRVRSSYKWDRIKGCLSSSSTCAGLNQSYSMAQDFFNAHLTPLQSGCCKPPTKCGYTFVNPTNWIAPTDMQEDTDCPNWSNDQTQLCYSCNSCKAGLLANIRKEWRRANIILFISLVALIFVYVAGFWAYRTAKTEELFRKYKQGYT